MANKIFGQNVKRMREERNLSMQDLAKILGVSKSSVNMWENAGVIPRESVLKHLSSSFNVSIDYLLGNITKEQEIKNKKEAREIDIAIQEFLGGLDEEDLEKMISVIKLILNGKYTQEFEKIEKIIRSNYPMYREAQKYGAVIGLDETEEDNIAMWKNYKEVFKDIETDDNK